jgi:predicted Rossmann fold flavoprotein
LSGVAQGVDLTLQATGAKSMRVRGALLWTHFGASGPAILDVSRHFLRARLEGRAPRLFANLLPALGAGGVADLLLQAVRRRPNAGLGSVLEGRLPTSVIQAVCQELGTVAAAPLSQLPRAVRRGLVEGLAARELVVRDSRGYDFAEVTAGGVPLEEVDLRTMESRRCPGLHLVGEILDVDGRLGGFNFQWAWSSASVASRGLALG